MRPSIYDFGPFSLDVTEHRLVRNGRHVPLTPRVFDLLCVLVENAGHLVEKERLLKEVWNGTFVEEGNLNRSISVLRKALGESATDRYIETIPKRGYRFVAAVREQALPPLHVASGPASDESGTRALKALALGAGAVLTLVSVGFLWSVNGRHGRPTTPAGAAIHRQLTFTGKEVTPTLSPDASRIAYVSIGSPHRKVVVQEVDGGQPIVVFTAPELFGIRWSPDSSEVLFAARGEGTDGVFIAPRSGGSARKIANRTFVTCWSPDGSTIALAWYGADKIRFVSRFGEELRTIALRGAQGWVWDLAWSSEHDRLLFVASDDERRPTIWSIRPDGSDQTRLLSTNTEILAARWGPADDSLYYFTRVNQTVSVFKAVIPRDFRSASTTETPLVSGLEADESFGLSADGRRLVYARAPYYSNLYLVEADAGGTHPKRTTKLTDGTSVVERPRVSPDGNSILFNMGYESRTNLYTMPAAGGSPKQLTFLNGFSVGGVWSPDGESVAFGSTEGGQPRVWMVKADGSSVHPLSTSDVSDNFNLTWASGARVLYQKDGYRNLNAIEPETRRLHTLFKDDGAGFVSSPEYSRDGKRIAFWSSRPPQGLWVMEEDGSGATSFHAFPPPSPLPIGWAADGAAVYAYDGKRAAARGLSVAFGETVSRPAILKIPLNGGPLSTVVELPFDEVGGVAVFPDGRRFVVSVYSSRSDIWIVENFDAATGARTVRLAK
jgi:Tol biopolymer transport system component/DNA-binding winged helix-turn-helix (wHTH) protein